MTGVTTKHADYTANIQTWKMLDDVCVGQKAIKAAGQEYLPVPVTFGDGDKERYKEYLDRAVFYGVTGRTLKSLIGSAFQRLPDFKRPDDFKYLERNADGAGRSIYQVAQRIVRLLMKHYRCGVYVDYPSVAPSANKAEDKTKNAYPIIHTLEAKSVINWDYIIVGNQRKYSLIVIEETVAKVSEDGFSKKNENQYRVLRLIPQNESFVYVVEVWTAGEKGEYTKTSEVIPKDYHGKTWDFIPFSFCGATDNSDQIDNAPLLELAEINLSHYRNSADVEESGFITGQAVLCMPNVTMEQYKVIKEDKLKIGSRSGFPTEVKFAQADENSFVKQLAADKWVQMKEMGARLVEVGSANKTATQADNEDSVQHSVLSLVVSNASEVLQMALLWCARFALPSKEWTSDDLTFSISQDFNKPKYDPVRSRLIYEACLNGSIPWYVWYHYEQTGTLPEDKWEDVVKKLEQQTDGGMNNPPNDGE